MTSATSDPQSTHMSNLYPLNLFNVGKPQCLVCIQLCLQFARAKCTLEDATDSYLEMYVDVDLLTNKKKS